MNTQLKRSLAPVALLLGVALSAPAAQAKSNGFTLGGNIAYLFPVAPMFGATVGYRTMPIDIILDGYWASASASGVSVSASFYRLNGQFNLGSFFIGPHVGLLTLTGSVLGQTFNFPSQLTVGGTLGFNIGIAGGLMLSPVMHLAIVPSMLFDIGAQLTFTF